jgi:hypothetical protein
MVHLRGLCFLVTVMTVGLAFITSPGIAGQSRIRLSPRCIADNCPQCPQPLDPALVDDSCRNCRDENFNAIARCGQLDFPGPLDLELVGLWRSKSGLSMLVIETTEGYQGRAHNIPEKLRKYYPNQNGLIMKAIRAGPGRCEGELWAPPGKWIAARFVTDQKMMISHHPKDNKVRWFKIVQIPHQNPGPEKRQ